ncbi:unnamed protein product [Pedinophyceae sp. YPF-701]|nr:unnamed protein product [Pedinophyceae sp. YPF-701]
MSFSTASLRVALPQQAATRPIRSYVGMAARPLVMKAEVVATPLLGAPSNGATVFAMRHGKRVAKLGRPADQRKALIRTLTTEVLRHGRIKTTVTRAKAIRPFVDKMITLSKRQTPHAKMQMNAFLYDKELVDAVFDEAAKRYADRNGGYCRVVRDLRNRRGDNAEMAFIELV